MNEKQEAAGNAVKERPILFSGPMVRALLDGSKTQTRRVVKPAPEADQAPRTIIGSSGFVYAMDETPMIPYPAVRRIRWDCPYGQPGDRLWVRESWQYADWTEDGFPFIGYSADGAKQIAHYVQNDSDGWGERLEDIWADLSRPENYDIDGRAADRRWRPSIHMPRWASRILLEIVSVRVERLNDCSPADAVAEGVDRVENNFGNGPAYRDYRMKANPDDTAEWFSSPIDSYRTLWEQINGPGSWDANPWVWVVEFKRVTP